MTFAEVSPAFQNSTTPLTALAGLTAMDFNPVVDRFRLAGSGNSNYRLAPDARTPAGQQANGFVSTDGNYGVSGFNVLGVAYTNPVDGTTGTTFYSLGSNGFLYSHSVASQRAIGLPQGVSLVGLAAVPEPSGVLLAGIGALSAMGIRRRSHPRSGNCGERYIRVLTPTRPYGAGEQATR